MIKQINEKKNLKKKIINILKCDNVDRNRIKKKQKFESIIIIKILKQNFIKYNEYLSISIQKKFEQKLFCNECKNDQMNQRDHKKKK